MTYLKLISNRNELVVDGRWSQVTEFTTKDRFVNEGGQEVLSSYSGRRYQIIEKRTRLFSRQERLQRGALAIALIVGIVAAALFLKPIFILGFFFCADSIKKLLIKSKESQYFALLDERGVPPKTTTPSAPTSEGQVLLPEQLDDPYEGLSDQEVITNLFKNYSKEDQYRLVDPTTCTSWCSSFQSVLAGHRPLALIGGEIQVPSGMQEVLLQAGFGVLKYNKTTQKEDGELRTRNFRKQFVVFKTGNYRSWIVYRPNQRQNAIALAASSLRKEDPYREQRIGRLLSYPEEAIRTFCNQNNHRYLEGELPEVNVDISHIDHQICESSARNH